MEEKYMSMITEYIDGTLTPEREKEFQQYVQEGHIDMAEVEGLAKLQGVMLSSSVPEPSSALKENFYQMLNEASEKSSQVENDSSLFERIKSFLFGNQYGRMAFGIGVLVIGLFLGTNFGNNSYKEELSDLNGQMVEMREMMMMAMLEKESVSDRLKGVQMSSELSSSNQKVIDALFLTLNSDPSTNVRIAALNTLAEYANDPQVRAGLVSSISQQKSPLMQVNLAELMVKLQETKAKDELKSILESDRTPEDVKVTLKESIEKII
ncbi:HEAT repeat domain-containing protein [Roseivirga sp.]|uniref:HEAT repeat domain-containing protein n=1 Tax=Roseivirga sp. TaxID=1964215 RepID=UPI002B26C762|nr:HEAT repeat domain-containing protein [Roseivirga sp.]